VLLHVIIFVHVNTIDFMSGSAALSAARKRRASTAPPAAGNGAPTSYYNRGNPSGSVPTPIPSPGLPAPSFGNQQYQSQMMPNGFPPQPMNIYHNIELIKQQLAERTKIIQTQGASLPAEKLKILQKQNEIQTQILKQKIAISKQMEAMGQGQGQGQGPEIYGNAVNTSIPTIPEPEFIYVKGVPQRNPKYMSSTNGTQQTPRTQHISTQKLNENDELNVTPFVTMISDTGVIPPPIVIIKSHDVKLQEHNLVLHELIQQLGELQSKVASVSDGSRNKNQTQDSSSNRNRVTFSENNDPAKDGIDADGQGDEEEEEEELLMDVVMNDLTNSREFVEGIVNKIVNETNLSEVIMKIEPLVKENQELRSLIHSQQQMMNEMNTMLLRLLNQGTASSPKQESFQDTGLDGDGLYQSEVTEIILTRAENVDQGATIHQGDSSAESSLQPVPNPEPYTQQTPQDDPNEKEEQPTENGNGGGEHVDGNDDDDANVDYTPLPPEEYSLSYVSEPVSLIVNEIQ
jgi:hypothetical protein